MNVIVNGRHLEITPALKSYSEEKIGKFEKYLSNITEAVVTLSVEKYRHKAEVLLKVNGVLIQAEGVTGEVYSAIDEVVEKLEKQVKKYKEKAHSYRKGEKKPAGEPPAAGTEEKGRIIKHKKFDMKPMSSEEAVHQMELLDKDFFVFANEITGHINVVYRRTDGNYGLIEPTK
ncbi:MAG: ribosome-associated translation inhibitor RaiA [Alphaproteobacteria bacterium]|uniref:Ribosome hibernation promoting factor n=1 Tax=Candidatus Nitrobium versatile TaxID=2884831 RepID=A0A953M1J7_9BACT|nr:ribosome-associated translation inhibitor RaiA [Candidatus Nitrobium versatile]